MTKQMIVFEAQNISAGYGGVDIIKSCNINVKQGEIVEKSSAEQVFNNPKDEYTKKLISSVPRINNIG